MVGEMQSQDMARRVVVCARKWIGTPYQHQGSCLGAGADCLGLIRGVWAEIYGFEPETIPNYSPDWSEPQHQERLWLAALRHLNEKPSNDAAVGDILLFRMRETGVAKHLGVASEIGVSPKFIHAYSGHGVLESPFSAPWQRRIVARFVFPEEG